MATVPAPFPLSTPFAPLAGWGGLLVVLVLVVAVALAFLAFLASRSTAHERSDWQDWLDARATRRPGGAAGAGRRAPQPVPGRRARPLGSSGISQTRRPGGGVRQRSGGA